MSAVFNPVLLRMYVFKKHTALLITSGQGMFQVDFKNYSFSSGKSLFLAPGQYFQLLTGGFNMLRFEFEEKDVRHFTNSRFLFNHLVGLGHIDSRKSQPVYPGQLRNIDIRDTHSSIISEAIEDWQTLNPFNADSHDTNLLFDLKEIIDEHYAMPVSLEMVSERLGEKPCYVNRLAKEKLDNTLNKLAADKTLLETKRRIVFTDLSAKEIAYETGFKDPDYFNRFFKKQTGLTPLGFRKKYEFDERDTFISELLTLLDTHYKDERFAGFYADRLSITTKTLLNRISQKLAVSFTHLVSERLLLESKRLLKQGLPVNVIAFNLGFKEPNHFSAFFRKLTGKTPTQFLTDL